MLIIVPTAVTKCLSKSFKEGFPLAQFEGTVSHGGEGTVAGA